MTGAPSRQWQSFPDAEAAEDAVEQVVGVDRPDHLAELVQRAAQLQGSSSGGSSNSTSGVRLPQVRQARLDVVPAAAQARGQRRPRRDRGPARASSGRSSSRPCAGDGAGRPAVRPAAAARSHFVATATTGGRAAQSALAPSVRRPAGLQAQQHQVGLRRPARGPAPGPAPRCASAACCQPAVSISSTVDAVEVEPARSGSRASCRARG